jgi:hypothetical protein
MSDNLGSPLTLRWVDDAVRDVRAGLDIGKEKLSPLLLCYSSSSLRCAFFLLLYLSLLVEDPSGLAVSSVGIVFVSGMKQWNPFKAVWH